MKIENNPIFYVYFCCIIIGIAFLNSCKAQKNEAISEKVDTYFEKLNTKSVQLCIDGVSDLSQFIKQRNNSDMHKYLLKSCEEEGSHFKLYKTDTEKLLSTLYKNESSDFIIVNMINPHNNRFLISTSTLTFSRKRNDQKINIINNKYKFNQGKQRYELVKDSSISGFDAEKKMKLIEDYFYDNKEDSISEKGRYQSVSEMYYVVGKINGEYLIKTLYDYSTQH